MRWLLHKTDVLQHPPSSAALDLAVAVTFRQRHVTQWLQLCINSRIPNFPWKCSGFGKENLASPLLCASFSLPIKWVWRHMCYQEYYLCSILERITVHFFEAIGQGTEPREGKQHFHCSVPRKVWRWVNYCIAKLFSTPVKNQDKPLSLNYIHNWMRWQETSGADEGSWSLIKWSNFIPLGMSCESQHGNTAGSEVCV